jgi:hypothetical protein
LSAWYGIGEAKNKTTIDKKKKLTVKLCEKNLSKWFIELLNQY